MLIVKVKICGITNYYDAVAAMGMGADILGFNFYPKSPRYLTPEKAGQIVNMLPAFIDTAGIFVNASLDQIRETTDLCPLDWVQLHGDESPEFCQSLTYHNVKTMKAIRIKDQADVEKAKSFFTDAVLLDAFHPGKYGGTGVTFDWSVVRHSTRRIFLAGGISPENAAAAVRLGVYGIDVCSGIEAEPGRKDHKKMKRLFDNIRHLRG
ncbi:MAG: phosphoribosylanthranilate isomerase [Planctomycetota bacterium]|jgi:phosphoribosylanthranilate isomerase